FPPASGTWLGAQLSGEQAAPAAAPGTAATADSAAARIRRFTPHIHGSAAKRSIPPQNAAVDAAAYARVALTNVQREFPSSLSYVATEPETVTRPRDLHPAFYGSFDWHSCVEMHWVLVRLLRVAPGLELEPE